MPLRSTKSTKPSTAVVFARATCGVALQNGLLVHLLQGQTWAKDDPLCQERPDCGPDPGI
jgi:hypothetical protein